MLGRAANNTKRGPRTILLWRAVLVLFTLRALIPVGYMPDFAGVEQGRIALAFCTASGGETRFVDLAGLSAKDDANKSGHHAHGGECPYAVAASPALFSAKVPVAPLFSSVESPAAHQQTILTSSSPRGPP